MAVHWVQPGLCTGQFQTPACPVCLLASALLSLGSESERPAPPPVPGGPLSRSNDTSQSLVLQVLKRDSLGPSLQKQI